MSQPKPSFCYKVISREYEYQLLGDVCIQTKIKPNTLLVTPSPFPQEGFVFLYRDGLLKIKQKYAWNGANVIPDTDANMFASLVHDALYRNYVL